MSQTLHLLIVRLQSYSAVSGKQLFPLHHYFYGYFSTGMLFFDIFEQMNPFTILFLSFNYFYVVQCGQIIEFAYNK